MSSPALATTRPRGSAALRDLVAIPILGSTIWAQFARLLVFGLPLAFLVASWFASAGFPFYFDNNETFLHYVAARNLENWDPNSYGWMTAEETDLAQPAPRFFYTHNPNGPRYLQYALLRLGVREMGPQVLILGSIGTLLTSLMLWRTFGHPALLVAALAVVLDYSGFLAWTANTFRIWMFVFFFGMVLTVRRDRPLWFGVQTFLLLQLDYGVAAYVGAATLTLALLTHRWRAVRFVLAAGIGAALSLAEFAFQALAFYGWDGLVNELTITYVRRGTDGAAAGPLRYLFQALYGPGLLLGGLAQDRYDLPVLYMLVAGLVFALYRLRRGQISAEHRFLAHLMLASVAGAVAASAVLYGYFVDAFIQSGLPLGIFMIAPAVALSALELRGMLATRWRSRYLGAICGLVVLLPIVTASVAHYKPPIGADLFGLLQTRYRGRTILAPNPGPAMADAELAFALTGGRADRTSGWAATPDDVRRYEGLRESDGSLTYLCVDTLYMRQIEKPDAESVCDEATTWMVMRGHEVLDRGVGWSIMRVNREPPDYEVPPEVGAR